MLRLYDILNRRRWASPVILTVVSLLLLIPALTLEYNEDVTDFLPFDNETKEGMEVYTQLSGSDRIIVLFEGMTRNESADAVEAFTENMNIALPDVDVVSAVDADQMQDFIAAVYDVAPVVMNDSDFEQALNIMLDADSVKTRLHSAKERLLFPGANRQVISYDPLNIFGAVMQQVNTLSPSTHADMENGCFFIPDTETAIAFVKSPYGGQETAQNKRLLASIDSVAVISTHVPAHTFGAIPIAVSNAERIKADSVISIAIAVVLIAVLLFFSFRRRRNLLLIPAAVGFGILFALGILGLMRDEVSLIVLGIAAVIVGIAVNYPLHFITHSDGGTHPRQVLRELARPLVIGNITTIGAFLCLVPLKARALQDLGLFAALLLGGTIIFVVIFLPHLLFRYGKSNPPAARALADRISDTRLDRNRFFTVTMLAITVILAYFCFDTRFDTDLRNINYLTEAHKSDTALLERMSQNADTAKGEYFIITQAATLDSALSLQEKVQNDVSGAQFISRIIPSRSTLKCNMERWNDFIRAHGDSAMAIFTETAIQEGFNPEAFNAFTDIVRGGVAMPGEEAFKMVMQTLGGRYITDNDGVISVAARVELDSAEASELRNTLSQTHNEAQLFNINEANSSLANSLSDEFNYIALACSLIVFGFLWLSFGRVELSIIAFAPMAISWIWILGLMDIFDLQFNIVNIILSTFIFGQGDDYTIFITEGVMYEYTYRRKMLASFKTGILISALIMFIGIGSLVFSQHPALLSLAWVTVLGMGTVVLMAYVIPPYLFNLLVRHKDRYREYPLTLLSLLRPRRSHSITGWVRARYCYKGAAVERAVRKTLKYAFPVMRHQMLSEPWHEIVAVIGDSYGCMALTFARMHPDVRVVSVNENPEVMAVVNGLSFLPSNFSVSSMMPEEPYTLLSICDYEKNHSLSRSTRRQSGKSCR